MCERLSTAYNLCFVHTRIRTSSGRLRVCFDKQFCFRTFYWRNSKNLLHQKRRGRIVQMWGEKYPTILVGRSAASSLWVDAMKFICGKTCLRVLHCSRTHTYTQTRTRAWWWWPYKFDVLILLCPDSQHLAPHTGRYAMLCDMKKVEKMRCYTKIEMNTHTHCAQHLRSHVWFSVQQNSGRMAWMAADERQWGAWMKKWQAERYGLEMAHG